MSNSSRLRHILKQIQIKLTSLGPTNRSRWTVFSTGGDLSVAQFSRRVASYGIKISTTDTATMWRAAGIRGNHLGYSEFETLLKAETSFPEEKETPKRPNLGRSSPKKQSPVPKSPKKTATPISSVDKIQTILFSSRRALLMKCLDSDPMTLGRVDKETFTGIINWFGIGDKGSTQSFTESLAEEDGSVNYMAFIDFLCGLSDQNPEKMSSRASPQRYEPSEIDFDEQNDSFEQEDNYQEEATPFRPNYPVSPVDTSYDLPSELRNKYYSPDSQRTNLSAQTYMNDPLIFGEYAHRQVGGSAEILGPRRNLDPDIFGPKPHREPVRVQKRQTADEVYTAERVSGLSPGRIVQLLATKIFSVFRNSKNAYSKWRHGDLLTIDDLRDGFARDCNVNIDRNDLQVVVDHYGGPMTMSTFARMLSDGTRIDEISRSPGGVVRETEDEEMINDIAGQIRQGGWEDIIFRCGSADEIAAGFETLGVNVTPEVIHILASKYGKSGLIDVLRAKTQ